MPAGQPAEFRSAAAANALRQTAAKDFAGLQAAWSTCLLQEGLLFYDKEEACHKLSLGFVGWSALLWKVDDVGVPHQLRLASVCRLCRGVRVCAYLLAFCAGAALPGSEDGHFRLSNMGLTRDAASSRLTFLANTSLASSFADANQEQFQGIPFEVSPSLNCRSACGL